MCEYAHGCVVVVVVKLVFLRGGKLLDSPSLELVASHSLVIMRSHGRACYFWCYSFALKRRRRKNCPHKFRVKEYIVLYILVSVGHTTWSSLAHYNE